MQRALRCMIKKIKIKLRKAQKWVTVQNTVGQK